MPVQLSDTAIKILEHRYFQRNEKGDVVEDAEELFRRVAHGVSRAELTWGNAQLANSWEEKFYQVMASLEFLPNSPTLMNAGTPMNQLSACFVLPVEDSMDGIFTTLRQAALIQQSGGGTGFNFSRLRPRNDYVSTTGGRASGPVSFMKIFDSATSHIKQGGKRRGANMGILNVDHPDIMEFIAGKKDEGILSNFNISVGITDAFMGALQNNASWNLKHPKKGTIVRSLPAAEIWKQLTENAWANGDPGLIFLDTINGSNPTPSLGRIEATNPCGEVPLLPFEACNLGSVNLVKMIRKTGTEVSINRDLLAKTIQTAIRFLDNVIEVNNFLVPEIRQMVQGNRKIGLGVMGWADLLVMSGIPYSSPKAIELAAELMSFVRDISYEASKQLALERGVFRHWEKSVHYPDHRLRNATRLSIAPTGTISMIADVSSSIEPLFALAYRKQHILDGKNIVVVNRHVEEYLKERGLFTTELFEQVKQTGTFEGISGIPETVRELFATALEIDPVVHLNHQAVFQQFTDNAVSKTVNLPEDCTPADIDRLFRLGWEKKLKGITIFRNRSRKKQVLKRGTKESKK